MVNGISCGVACLALTTSCRGAPARHGDADTAVYGARPALAEGAVAAAGADTAWGDSGAEVDGEAGAPTSSDAAADRASSNATTGRERPIGTPLTNARYACSVVLRGGAFRAFLANDDARRAFVDGDDWLALVNRSPTGALSPDYAPADLVDVRDGTPRLASECEARECLRRDAAEALRRMFDAMGAEGIEGRIQSAFRGFSTQCWVFAAWAHQARNGFCEAAEQSALPGHSQHQLGTTLDLFTKEWADDGAKTGRGVFRNGFGCTKGGHWLDENAWHYGFIVAYPIHPDDRKDGSRCAPRQERTVPIDPQTGYKNEPWHVRFLGVAAATAFHEAWQASGPGTASEITLEQWLRGKRGLKGDADLPVCDGCQCGACSTLAGDDARTPCGKESLQLDSEGRVLGPSEDPRLISAHLATAAGGAVVVEVKVHAPAHTPTQTPVIGPAGIVYGGETSFVSVVAYQGAQPHAYPDLPGAWRVAIQPWPETTIEWPWRASLAAPELAVTWNRANLVLPAKSGDSTVRVAVLVPAGTQALRVALIRDGVARDALTVSAPSP